MQTKICYYIFINTPQDGDDFVNKDIKMLEESLYTPVKDYFSRWGYKVKGEVHDCDVSALKGETFLVVEMKKTLNLEVILQATLRQKIADVVYIAVPKNERILFTKRWKNICHLLERLEIGLLLVSFRGDMSIVEEVLKAEPFNPKKDMAASNRKRVSALREFSQRRGDYNTGGSTKKKLVTAYREKALHIAALIKIAGPLGIKQLKKMGTDREKTPRILQDNHYGWFERISRGVYNLSDRGKIEIEDYKEHLKYYASKM